MAVTKVDRIAGGASVSIPVSLTTSMGATTTDGILLGATNSATAGAQVFSPALHFQGSGWDTGAGAGRSCDWKAEVQPVQGNPATNNLALSYSYNGGAYTVGAFFSNNIAMTFGQPGIYAQSLHSASGILTAGNATQTAFMIEFASQNIILGASNATFCWSSSAITDPTTLRTGKDTGLSRISAGVVGVGNGTAADFSGNLKTSTLTIGSTGTWVAGAGGITIVDSNSQIKGPKFVSSGSGSGELWTMGYATELLTLSTGGTTTDTVANLLPAGAIIEAVVARVTTTITTATSWQLGDPTTAGRFTAANATMAAGTTDIGILHWSGAVATLAAGPSQAAAAKVRVTTVGTPGAGVIRITVFYRQFTAPTS